MAAVIGLLCLGTLILNEHFIVTAGLTLTANIFYPDHWVSPQIKITTPSILATPDDKLLVAISNPPRGLSVINLMQPTDVVPMHQISESVQSMALLNGGNVVVTYGENAEAAKILDLGDGNGEETQTVRTIRFGFGVEDGRVASIPSSVSRSSSVNNNDESIVLSGYDMDTDATFIDVVAMNGELIERLADGLDMLIEQMVVHGDDIYLTVWEDRPSLQRFNMATRTFVPNIGELNLESAFGDYEDFTQGGFDQNGNLYIGANQICYAHTEDRCCGCVLRISPEGEKRIVVPLQIQEQFVNILQAVTVTSRGIAVAYTVYKSNLENKVLVQLYDFDELDD